MIRKTRTVNHHNPPISVQFRSTFEITTLKLQNLVYPVSEFADSGVDPGLVGLSAADSPRDDPREEESLVVALDHHGSPGVSLAGVKPTPSPPGADEDVGDVLDVARRAVHRLADRVVDYRDGHFLEDARQGAVCNQNVCFLL